MTFDPVPFSRHSLLGAFFLLVAASLLGHAQLAAQVRIVPDAVTCSRCVINLQPVATPTTGDSALFTIPGDVLMSSNGSLYFAEFGELPRIFGTDGRYRGDLGRRGSGPGEFTGTVGFSQLPGDSLLVHLDDGRVVVVDPSNTPQRQVTLPSVLHPMRVLDWPRRVLATGFMGTPGGAGYPLHVLDLSTSQARVLASFGWDGGRMRANAGMELSYYLTNPRNGEFWAADPLEYRIGKWNASGDSLAHLTRSPEWFLGRSRAWIGNPTTPPPPMVIGFAEDDEGLLWVYSRVGQRNWKAAWPQVSRETRELGSGLVDREKLFEVVVEVIDPRRARVVYRETLRQYVVHVLEGGEILTYRATPEGSPEFRILRPVLRRP